MMIIAVTVSIYNESNSFYELYGSSVSSPSSSIIIVHCFKNWISPFRQIGSLFGNVCLYSQIELKKCHWFGGRSVTALRYCKVMNALVELSHENAFNIKNLNLAKIESVCQWNFNKIWIGFFYGIFFRKIV